MGLDSTHPYLSPCHILTASVSQCHSVTALWGSQCHGIAVSHCHMQNGYYTVLGSRGGSFTSLAINPTPVNGCDLMRGTNATVNIKFKTGKWLVIRHSQGNYMLMFSWDGKIAQWLECLAQDRKIQASNPHHASGPGHDSSGGEWMYLTVCPPQARVMIAQWENECISLAVLPRPGSW